VGEEQRIAERWDSSDPVQVETEGRLHACTLKNLSVTGAAVALAECRLATEQQVTLWLSDTVSLPARVVWTKQAECGMAFLKQWS